MGKLDNVKFISASAGSGKTYSLTQNMVQFIEQGLNPESFILTTFTKAAAAEFKEKSKAALFKKAQEVDSEKKHIFLDAAARIDNATIGTIHSVAHQFISQYWYLLGISPEIKVITDEDKAFYMNQSLMGCVAKDDLNFFNSLTWNFEIRKYLSSEYDFEFWKNDVEKLIAATVSFNIQELDKYCTTSKKLLKQICGIYNDNYYVLPSEGVIINSVMEILDCVAIAPRIKREEKKGKIISILNEFKESKDNALFRYKILATKLGNEKTDGLYQLSSKSFDLIEECGNNLYRTEAFAHLLEQYIEKIFSIVRSWTLQYSEYKKKRQIADFADLERLFCNLLDIQQVRDSISEKYSTVMVDEFQDCSPVQVEIFKKLQGIVGKNIWVGDIKQAIYQFRGTDVSLVQDVIDEIRDCGDKERFQVLEQSWRSAPILMNFANDVFEYAFKVHNGFDEKLVRLESSPKTRDMSGEMEHWHFKCGKSEERYKALANSVKNMAKEKGLEWKDIAVLVRNNNDVVSIAAELKAKGIPVHNLGEVGVDEDELDILLKAIVSYAVNENNLLSLEIVKQRLCGYECSKIADAGKKFKGQPVQDFIESLFVGLQMDKVLQLTGFGSEKYIHSSIQKFIKLAQAYEERCSTMNLGASLSGFVDCLQTTGNASEGEEDGVTVATYHKSKGLEWKAVVLWGLNNDYLENDFKCIGGVQAVRPSGKGNEEYLVTLYPGFVKNFVPVKALVESADSDTGYSRYNDLHQASLKESVRLLYVGVTRAKNILVTTSFKYPKIDKSGIQWFSSALNSTALANYDETSDTCRIAVAKNGDNKECNIPVKVYDYDGHVDLEDMQDKKSVIEIFATPEEKNEYPLLYLQPSKMQFDGEVEVCQPIEFGERVQVKGEDSSIGDCIHHFMQLYGDDLERNRQLLERLAVSYGVSVDCEAVVSNAEAFWRKLDEVYKLSGLRMKETPFSMVYNGQVVNGEIDLLCETADGDILVDYKTFQGSKDKLLNPDKEFWVGKYAGQLAAYRKAVEASGRTVKATYICYISLGLLVELKF